MTNQILDLIERLNNPILLKASVIPWGSPIISFGDINKSQIATLGLNPSNREFVDIKGKELSGNQRRFHTLSSLNINNWSEVKEIHASNINELCEEYFYRNPYDGWFKQLDYIISGTSMSYYFPSGEACHLDLIPYATSCKWTDLTLDQKNLLLKLTGDTLGLILQNSPVKLLVLNGQTVVDTLQKISNVVLKKKQVDSWTLPRKDSDGVAGFSYTGTINNIGGIVLSQPIAILGYNHNIQSSYGVTSQVKTSIRNWVTRKTKIIIE